MILNKICFTVHKNLIFTEVTVKRDGCKILPIKFKVIHLIYFVLSLNTEVDECACIYLIYLYYNINTFKCIGYF